MGFTQHPGLMIEIKATWRLTLEKGGWQTDEMKGV
jgi:hypothetical protein